MTIIVAASIAGVPGHGGWTWAVLQYVLGLRRLGHDVLFLDPIKSAVLQPAATSLASSRNATYFQRVVRDFGLECRSALLLQDEPTEAIGLSMMEVTAIARRADLLINVSGALDHHGLLGQIQRRAYLDLDPAYTQLWHAVQGIDMGFDAHTDFATVGLEFPPDGRIPTLGRRWIPTLQPIVLEHWPVVGRGDFEWNAFTTVANWRGYGSIEHAGKLYGQKAHSFRRFLDLPRRTSERFVLALGIHPEETRDLEALREHRWQVVDPDRVADTPEAYRQFIRGSRGELAIAKSGYVEADCGWFSDRSVCYLASGRPVVAQETGFSRFLPTGEGLLAFRTVEEAAAAIERVRADYDTHAGAARRVAEQHFDSDLVLPALLRQLGATA